MLEEENGSEARITDYKQMKYELNERANKQANEFPVKKLVCHLKKAKQLKTVRDKGKFVIILI